MIAAQGSQLGLLALHELATNALNTAVVGPAGSLADAMRLVEDAGDRLDGAVLDIHLGEDRAFPLADALTERAVPFDALVIPETYAAAPRCEKPVNTAQLARIRANATPRGERGPAAAPDSEP